MPDRARRKTGALTPKMVAEQERLASIVDGAQRLRDKAARELSLATVVLETASQRLALAIDQYHRYRERCLSQ